MKRLMTLLVSALTAGVALCAARTHVALDTRTGTRYARAEEPIAFSTGWSEGVTRLVLTIDGVNVLTTTTATNGVYVWKPDLSTTRAITLKHVTRGAVNEALEATFTTAAYDVTFAAGAHGALAAGVPATQRVPHGEAAETPEVVPATGYRFTGWSADTSRVTAAVTATALYEAIPYAITYEDLFGATHANPSTYTIEDGVTFTAPSSIPRRRFVRWEPVSIAAGSTGAVTVRAVWEMTPCVYVDAAKGSDDWDGSSAEQAVKTLARAYALAEAGDVIVVAAGTYAPLTATGKAVTFRGADGATIDGGSITRCVTADDDVVFQNFILQNGYDAEAGGGVYGGTFERCTIRDCHSDWDGGGAYEATLRYCVLVGNEAENGWGGGAYGGALVGCVVKNNVAGDEGGGVYDPEILLDTTFSGNSPEDVPGDGGTVKAGGSFAYAPSESAAIHVIPHDWFLSTGLAKVGDPTAGLDAKLAATYANGRTGWESYVAGLKPNDASIQFRAEITIADGQICLSWTPDLNSNGVTRIYTVAGRTDLDTGDWEPQVQPWHRFFKVEVTMPTGAFDEKSSVAGEGFVPKEKPLGGVQLWENGPYWAECNVGATKPEEYGYYFWWGDTVGYVHDGSKWVASDGSSSDFTFNNCDNENPTIATMWKDNAALKSEGWIDEDGSLTAAHDAATAHLGAPWRIPPDADFLDLINKCDWSWETCNGVRGWRVTGKGAYSSKSIFLPAAGYGYDSSLYDLGSGGYYWSSTPNSDFSDDAWYLYFFSSNFLRYGNYRCDGQSVRPLRGFAQ